MAAFTDFHVGCSDQTALTDLFHSAIKLGYDWLAVSTFVAELSKKGKKQQQQQNAINAPQKVKLSEQSQELLKSSPEVQAYDLLAVQPTNEGTFKLACTTLEVDIITLNMTEKLPYYFKRPLVNLAVERGIHFEILYGPANIIISSGCEKAIELRGPYDSASGQLFGLTSPQSKDAICKSCRAVVMHAEARKITKSVVSVIKSSELSPADKWVLDTETEETAVPDPESSGEKLKGSGPPKKKRKT
ncbi:hypothetical protein BaRGS_00010417 [Batillaria attramentaria]|uniref:Uncharacterized protein n=1 Tax=Batillaria attramentaria TaxID=370345 RepID=A0ABD0LGU8_9CAEN